MRRLQFVDDFDVQATSASIGPEHRDECVATRLHHLPLHSHTPGPDRLHKG